jgi:hypothetical protein
MEMEEAGLTDNEACGVAIAIAVYVRLHDQG